VPASGRCTPGTTGSTAGRRSRGRDSTLSPPNVGQPAASRDSGNACRSGDGWIAGLHPYDDPTDVFTRVFGRPTGEGAAPNVLAGADDEIDRLFQ
jgi:hypothetical protein